ncbi:MAG: FkbM family methyltransferase [Gemmataceae bacterium]
MPRPKPMISYAQNREDVLLERAFAEVEHGFYVDVGANDPEICSLTRHFYEHGWRGLNIEPAAIFHKLQATRPRDINLNVAVSTEPGTMELYEFPAANGLTTLEANHDHLPADLRAGMVTRTVPVRPLRDLLAEVQPPTIDFLSVDVEGHERQVLLSNDWGRWRPRVVVVEATQPLTTTSVHDRWEPILLAADYQFAIFDGLNRYYVRREDSHLGEILATPVNVFDNFLPADLAATTVDTIRQLREREQAYQVEIDRLGQILTDLHRGTGARTLAMGLWLARQLNTLGRGRHLIRRLLRPAKSRAA